MGSLPLAVTRGIMLTVPEAVMMYAILIVLAVFIYGKKKLWLFVFLSLLIIVCSCFLADHYQLYSRKQFIVYDIKKSRMYDFTEGGKSILVGDLAALKDAFFADNLKKSRWMSKTKGLFEFQYPLPGSKRQSFSHDGIFYKRGSFMEYCGKRFMILDRPLKGIRKKMNVDYLIISGNPKLKLEEVVMQIGAGEIIFDPTNSITRVKAWTKEAHFLGIKTYSVSVSGAFCRDIN
jgi:competence protein ComEC